ncbi:MAG: hypothetical protein ACPHP1_05280 [Miltoncostaeaceae bacterium]
MSWKTPLGARGSRLKRLAGALIVMAVAPAVGSASVTDQLNAALNGPGVLFRTPDGMANEKVPGTYLSNQINPPTSVYQSPGNNGNPAWTDPNIGQPSPWCGVEPDDESVTDAWGGQYQAGKKYSTLFDGYFVQDYAGTTGDCNSDAYDYAIVGNAAIGDIKSIANTFYPTDANALDARFASDQDSKTPSKLAPDGRGCHYDQPDPKQDIWNPNQTDARNSRDEALVGTVRCRCMDPALLPPQAWVSQWIRYAGNAEGAGPAKPNSKATWLVLSSMDKENPAFWFNTGDQITGFGTRTVKRGFYKDTPWYEPDGRKNKAPMWGLDLASCWYENPEPMVALQNELWQRRGEWWNGYAPRPPSGHERLDDPIGMKYYWGWNEVVLDKARFESATVANVVKLPAGQARIAELSPAAQDQLARDLAAFPRGLPVVVMSESLVPGTQDNNPQFRRSFSCQPYDFGSIAISCTGGPSTGPSTGPSSSTGVIVPSDPANKTEPCSRTFFQMAERTATFDSSRKAWRLVSRIKIMQDAEKACRTKLTFIYTNVQRSKRFKQLPGSTLGYRTLKGKNFSAPVISWPTSKEMKYQSGGKKNARLVLVSYVVKPASIKPKNIRLDIVRVIPTNPAAPVSESNRKGAQQSVLTTKKGWAQVISRPTP